jgi:hypothetical protein
MDCVLIKDFNFPRKKLLPQISLTTAVFICLLMI